MDQGQGSGGSLPVFETLKRVNKAGAEYWSARDLYRPLGYDRWEHFPTAIQRAIHACEQFDVPRENHFLETTKKVLLGDGAQREVADYWLSRFACYLIAMNGDPRKPEIAEAQSYFAIQTRRQELQDQQALPDRLGTRLRVAESNKSLASAAKDAGVTRYALFQDSGYRGLYGGVGMRDLKARRGVSEKEELLDRMGTAELAANHFRITQTDEHLRRGCRGGEPAACNIHRKVGRRVRDIIIEFGNPPPETLPLEPSLKPTLAKLKRAEQKALKPGPSGA
jgi:DNA-damage-inducible protein D